MDPASRASGSASFILRWGFLWRIGNCRMYFCWTRKETEKPATHTDSWTRLAHGKLASGRPTTEDRI